MDFFKIVYNYTFIMQLIALCLSLLIIFYPFERSLRSFAIAALHFAILFLANTLLTWGLYCISRIWRPFMGLNFLLAWLIVIGVYTCCTCRKNFVGHLMMAVTLYVVFIAIGDFGRDFTRIVIKTYSSMLTVMWYGFVVAVSFVLRRFSLKKYDNIPVSSGVLMGLCAVCISSLVYLKTMLGNGFVRPSRNEEIYYLVSCFVVFLVAVINYMLVYLNCEKSKELTESLIAGKLLEADKQALTVSRQAIAELHEIRHDIKNQFNIIKVMLSERQYAEAESYLDSLTDAFLRRPGNLFIDCGNTLINSVVNMEILKANSYGIYLSAKIKVPEKLPFEDSDLCRLIVNLLDNAIEGVARARGELLVDCKIIKQDDFLYIGVQNEVSSDSDQSKLLKFETEKEDSAKHGFGHRIVKRIIDKYNGYVNYKVETGWFFAEVMLDCSSVKEKTK